MQLPIYTPIQSRFIKLSFRMATYSVFNRYLETYNLVDKFHDRVQEEIDYHIDPAAKDRRLQRQTETRRTILNRMSTKYRLGSDFSTLVDEDEVGNNLVLC